MRAFLRNMWALQPEPLDAHTLERLDGLVGRLADAVVRRGLATPAVLVLDSAQPLAFAGSQALVFLEPLVRAFLEAPDYDLLIRLLEDRDRVEALIEAIEAREP